MSFDALKRTLGDEIRSLETRRVAPILIAPIHSRLKLLQKLQYLSLVYFFMILGTRVTAFFTRSFTLLILEESIHVVVLLGWVVLFRKRREVQIKLTLQMTGRVMINGNPLMGEPIDEEAPALEVMEDAGLDVVRPTSILHA